MIDQSIPKTELFRIGVKDQTKFEGNWIKAGEACAGITEIDQDRATIALHKNVATMQIPMNTALAYVYLFTLDRSKVLDPELRCNTICILIVYHPRPDFR